MNSETIPVSVAARLLHSSTGTIMRLLEEGKLRGFQPNGPKGWWRIERASINELIEAAHKKYAERISIGDKR